MDAYDLDSDNDDVPDAAECGSEPSDPDEDGKPNSRDPDSDGDDVRDASDNCRLRSNPEQEDQDGDGVGNKCDNCPGTSNLGQADLDGDGRGDACDDTVDLTGPECGSGTSLSTAACGSTVTPLLLVGLARRRRRRRK